MSASVATVALQLEKASQFAEAGQVQPAVQLCQQILAEDETYAPAYGLMSDILRRMGNYPSAEKFINLAVRFDDANPSYRIQKAQTLYSLNRVDEALKELDTLLRRFPNLAVAHLLTGDFLLQQKKYEEALSAFATVRMLEDMPGLGEHVGLCYMEMGKLKEAEEQFLSVIERMPDYFRPYLLVGQIRLQNKDEKTAEDYFDKAIALNPAAYQAWSGKGAIEQSRKNDAAALQCFQRALQSNPGNYHPYYILGTFLQQSKRLQEAEPLLRKCVEMNPSFLPAQIELSLNLYNTGRKQESLAHIDTVLAGQPDNVGFLHMRAGIVGETPENAPASFVSGLFDDYAEMFDQHLVSGLDYHIPEKTREALLEAMKDSGDTRHDLSLLDLGCGTGLGAAALHDLTGWRVGVDLSAKMVEKAREKRLYDTLAVADVVEYLERSLRQFDLITALDVLVYIGNLAPLFAAATAKLTDGGYFSLSVETSDETETFVLQPSGRYGHATTYLEKLAAKHGLKILVKQATSIRSENHEPIPGYLFIFQK